MEPNAGETRGKRKAETISPTREDPSQSTPITNDRGNGTVEFADEGKQDSSVSGGERDEDEASSEEMREDDEEEYSDEEMDAYENEFYEDFDDEEEPAGWEETEVEQKEYTLGDQKLTFKIFLAEDGGDEDQFTHWMQTIRVCCSYEGKMIGYGFGRYVRRNRIRKTFWRDMEEPCQDLSNIAFKLFTRYGCLRKEFKVHPIQKGTGAWGSELDLGSFFVIEHLIIDKEWRRKTIGTRIVSCLIEKSRANGRQPQFSLVLPGWLRDDIGLDIRGKAEDEQRKIKIYAYDNAVSFYRLFGFRRIGASSCFGLATDPSHPAHAIMPADDFDPAEEDPDDDGDSKHENNASCGVDQNPESSRLERLKDRLPLHHAATTLPDSECVEFFRARKTAENQIDEWKKLDRYFNNVLHIAARELKVQTVCWLINDSGQGQTLNSQRNLRGYTPVEELESNLETKRTRLNRGMMTLDISDYFSGFPSEAIGCLAALRNLDAPSEIQYAQLKFGCTCGLCVDGLISPRMSFALLCQAELTCDILSENVEDGKMWCEWHDHLITHVAPDIQRNFATNKSYRKGFANIFHHAANTLRNNRSPTISNILHECIDASEWPPHTKSFLQRGGKIESVLRIMFENAEAQDECAGDGEHMTVFEDEIKALPECRNDHEFGFAALACDIPNLTRLYE